MNEYGQRAHHHWKTYRPKEYAKIPNPEDFFAQIGQEAAKQIDQLQMTLAGEDLPREAYQEKASRLNMARLRAEEAVMNDLLLPPEDETDSETGEDEAADATGPQGPESIGPHEIIGPGHPLFEEIDEEHRRLNRGR